MDSVGDSSEKQTDKGKPSAVQRIEQLMDQFAFDWDTPAKRETPPKRRSPRGRYTKEARATLKNKISKEVLERLYHEEGRSPENIAWKFGVISQGVLYLLKEYGISAQRVARERHEDEPSLDCDTPPMDRLLSGGENPKNTDLPTADDLRGHLLERIKTTLPDGLVRRIPED